MQPFLLSLFSMKYILFLGFILLLCINCVAQNPSDTEYDRLYSELRKRIARNPGNIEYDRFRDSVNREWEKKYEIILKDPCLSERKKDSLISPIEEANFYAACYCSYNREHPCAFSGAEIPCTDFDIHRYFYFQELKPVEVPVFKLKKQ